MTSGGRAVQRGAMYVLRFETATPNKANETVNITVPPAMVKPILSRVVIVEVYLQCLLFTGSIHLVGPRLLISDNDDNFR
jgi:hypothetical protein